jgi:hypothetical protein
MSPLPLSLPRLASLLLVRPVLLPMLVVVVVVVGLGVVLLLVGTLLVGPLLMVPLLVGPLLTAPVLRLLLLVAPLLVVLLLLVPLLLVVVVVVLGLVLLLVVPLLIVPLLVAALLLGSVMRTARAGCRLVCCLRAALVWRCLPDAAWVAKGTFDSSSGPRARAADGAMRRCTVMAGCACLLRFLASMAPMESTESAAWTDAIVTVAVLACAALLPAAAAPASTALGGSRFMLSWRAAGCSAVLGSAASKAWPASDESSSAETGSLGPVDAPTLLPISLVTLLLAAVLLLLGVGVLEGPTAGSLTMLDPANCPLL